MFTIGAWRGRCEPIGAVRAFMGLGDGGYLFPFLSPGFAIQADDHELVSGIGIGYSTDNEHPISPNDGRSRAAARDRDLPFDILCWPPVGGWRGIFGNAVPIFPPPMAPVLSPTRISQSKKYGKKNETSERSGLLIPGHQ